MKNMNFKRFFKKTISILLVAFLVSTSVFAKSSQSDSDSKSTKEKRSFFDRIWEFGVTADASVANNYFETDGNFVKANDGGLVSVSRETPSWNRSNLLAHEGWHTLFFKDADFRNYVSAVYNTMDPYSLSFLIKYFQSQSSLGYDVTDEYLMNNEFMAYMLQQNLSYITDYYVLRASWGSVVKFCPNEAEYIKKTNARGLEDAAIALNDYVFDNYGLVAGNIYLVTR